MCLRQQDILLFTLLIGLLFNYKVYAAVVFEPGIGLGIEHSDNATLSHDDPVDDLIFGSYVGARVADDEGSLIYDATTSFNKHNYTQDSFEDQRYFNLRATADWAMIKDRLHWFITNSFTQSEVVSLGSNTPNNLQDGNVFTFGANINFPISARQHFSLVPMFSQFYYEVQPTDNKQYSLAANWNYQMFRLTNVGLNLSTRNIDYTEKNLLGESIENITFTNIGVVVSGQRMRSRYSVTVGQTGVKRDNGQETSGFAGSANWNTVLSSRSTFSINASTDLTDSSNVAASGGDNVQITTDVVRFSAAGLVYARKDASLSSHISARYTDLEYSENSQLNRTAISFDAGAEYPITGLLASGIYLNIRQSDYSESFVEDESYTIGGNLRYNFSRKLRGLFDLKYRNKESTLLRENYDEFSVFFSLVYGFGEVLRPTRVGGY